MPKDFSSPPELDPEKLPHAPTHHPGLTTHFLAQGLRGVADEWRNKQSSTETPPTVNFITPAPMTSYAWMTKANPLQLWPLDSIVKNLYWGCIMSAPLKHLPKETQTNLTRVVGYSHCRVYESGGCYGSTRPVLLYARRTRQQWSYTVVLKEIM